jgi:FMN-dependent oxidoreductase (nitrilotriacetate monooxygenase family)
MSQDPFHLTWFLSSAAVQGWGTPFTGNVGREWTSPDLYVRVAQDLERACFDYVLLEDNLFIGDTYQGSTEVPLRHAVQTPRLDPLVLAPWMLQATRHLSIVPTITTFAYHPYQLARQLGTLDQLSGGRAGWNMVTGSSDRGAQNLGYEAMEEHDTRYEMADEFVEIANRLWRSWEPGAVVADAESGVFADHTKVHEIDFEGQWYQTRGPLNSGPPPQGTPVLAQAGSSPRGREFAAKHADTVVGSERSIEGMKSFRDDIRSRMSRYGRKPDECKILFVIHPFVGGSMEEAQEKKRQRDILAESQVHQRLAVMSKTTGIDFGQFPLDEPLADGNWTTNGSRASLERFLEANKGRTIREAVLATRRTPAGQRELNPVGTPDHVAGEMAEIMQEVGGDGYMFGSDTVSRRTVAEIVDGVVPELQRRGVVRQEYTYSQGRQNLMEF